MKIALVAGTARKSNYTRGVVEIFREMLNSHKDVEVETVFPEDHVKVAVTVPPYAEGGTDTIPTLWQRIARDAHGFLFVLPEYNHGYPGEWKLLVDSLKKEYKDKPAALIGVSSGMVGGARVVEQVKPILIDLELFILKRAFYVRNVESALQERAFVHEKDQKDALAFADLFINYVKKHS